MAQSSAFGGIFGQRKAEDASPATREATQDSTSPATRGRHGSAASDSHEEKPTEQIEKVREITREVLRKYMLEDWDSKSHKHITFRGKEFVLESLEGLVRLSGSSHEAGKIDLTHLESFDVSENALRDLSCLRGTQGFSSLRVLKARRNVLVYFEVNLPTLRELDLSHNRLKELPPTSGMPQLEVCVLAHNEMNSTFEPLRNCRLLKKLDLSYNRFSCRPTELGERLAVLETLPLLHALRLKDNPFCRLLPEYQAFVLQRLFNLSKFDDMENIREAKELSWSTFDAKKLDDYDKLIFERGKADRRNKEKRHELQGKESLLPTFQELMEPISNALAESTPENINHTVKELIRICDKIHGANVEHMSNIFRELKHQQKENGPTEVEIVDSVINQFLGDFALLHSRVDEDEAQRVMLLRCLAKLGCVHTHDLGEKCMNQLGWLMKRSPKAESEVLKVVEEIVVEPLKFRGIQDKQIMPVIKGLAKFDSPKLPNALAPIAGWLAKSYCNYGSTPQQDVTRLLAVATRSQVNTERALSFHGTGDTLTAGGKQDDLALHVILALENKTLAQNESLREQFMGHLQIVTNTARYGGQRVVEMYEEKGLHRDLVRMCNLFFGGEAPIDTTKPYTMTNPRRTHIDLTNMKVLDIRTCAALLDAIAALMEQSHDIMLDLVEAKPPSSIPVVEYYSIAARAPIADPVLLAASLKGLTLILEEYSHENAAVRNEMISLIIKDLEKMATMLEYISSNSQKYQLLWEKAEIHLAQRAEGGSGKASRVHMGTAPKLTAVTNPLMHEAFEAVVMVIKYFTAQARDSRLCAQVSQAMDGWHREQLLFQLLQVPSTKVRTMIMATLNEVDSAEMSSEEVGYLIMLLAAAKDLSREDELLRQVVMQLQKFAAERDGAGAGAALRSDHANTSIDAVMSILLRNSMRKTFTLSEESEKTYLSRACVLFLKTVSKWPDLRETNLRSKKVSGSLIDVLHFEDDLHSSFNPDVGAEGTWTGRSVETLLQCVSGGGRLKARGKVAYRVLSRIADVLEGRSDMPRSADIAERTCKEMAEEECKMFDEARLKREVKYLDDAERSDRALQQQVFASFNGLDRLLTFLTDLYGNLEKKQLGRRMEQTGQEKAIDFLQSAKQEAKKTSDSAIEDLTFGQGDEPTAALEDAGSDDDQYRSFPIATFNGGSFPSPTGTIDLHTGKDGMGFAGAFGNAVSITFQAVVDQPMRMASIIDMGSGGPSDNIVVLADGQDVVFQIYDGSNSTPSELRAKNAITTRADVEEPRRFLLTVTERGEMKISVAAGQVEQSQNNFTPKHRKRQSYLVGASSLEYYGHSAFHGDILNLHVFSGALEWQQMQEQLQHSLEMGGECRIDRKLVMRVMNRFDPLRPEPAKPDLLIGASLGACPPRELQVREEFMDSQGAVNVAMPIAAALRCCFALLKVPAADHIRQAMCTSLKDHLVVGRLLSLVAMVGPFDCCIAAKFMRLMSVALKLPASQAREEADRVIIFDQLSTYYGSLCGIVGRAVRQNDDAILSSRGRMAATEIARLASVIITTIPFCTNGLQQETSVQLAFFEQCYVELMPKLVVKNLVQMALDASKAEGGGGAAGDKTDNQQDMDQTNQMWELLRVMISALLDKCPKMKYDIFMIFSTHIVNGAATLRQSFLSGVLLAMKNAEDKAKMQQSMGDVAIPEPEPIMKVGLAPEGPERTIAFARCEAFSKNSWLRVLNPGSDSPFLAAVVTNKALLIIDASAGGYPKNPKIVEHRDLRDITRLVRGSANQVIYVGLLTREKGEEFMVLVCHRESDRRTILGSLHSLSMPPGGDHSSRVPLQTDPTFKKAFSSTVADLPILTSFAMREVQDTREMKLFVLTENQFYEISTNFEHWEPAEHAKEAGSESDRESGGDDDVAKQQLDSKAEGNQKQKDEAMLSGIFGGSSAQSSQAKELAAQADEIMLEKRKARQKGKQKESDKKHLWGKHDPSDKPIDPVDLIMKLSGSGMRQMNNLEKCAFYQDGICKIGLNFGEADKVNIVFYDDLTRETWKRAIVAQLTRADQGPNKWVRKQTNI